MIGIKSIPSMTRISRNNRLKGIYSNFILNSPKYTPFDILGSFNSYTAQNFYSTSTSGPGEEKVQWRQKVVGAQPAHNLKVGPYKRGKWFVSYKEDPGSFITNILIILVTGYAIFALLPGESMRVRRQRKLRQMLLDKANLTESELNYIENYKLDIDNKEKIN